MGNYEYATTIGSGAIPHISDGPHHGITPGTFPVPDQRHALRTRRGDGMVVLNPEDFSVSIGLRSSVVSVTTSATALPTIPLEFRRALVIHNNGASTVFLGASDVTISTGFPLLAGADIAFDIQNNQNVVVYAIATGTVEVRVLELS